MALECDVMSLVAINKTGVFYTDYVLFPSLGLQGRKLLALVFGSSSNIFILAKAPKREPTNACL